MQKVEGSSPFIRLVIPQTQAFPPFLLDQMPVDGLWPAVYTKRVYADPTVSRAG